MKTKSLTSQTVFTIISTLLLNALSFITVPIFANLLSSAGYGTVSLYSSYVETLSIVMGLQTYSTISVAVGAFKGKEYERYCSSALSISVIGFSIVTILSLAFISPIANFLSLKPIVIVLMLFQSAGSFVCSFYSYKFIYAKEAQKAMLLSLGIAVLTTVLSIGLIFLFRLFTDDYLGRIVGLAIPPFVIGIVFLVVQYIHGRTFFDKKYWAFCFAICIPMVFHNLSQVVLSQTDKVMLDMMLEDRSLVGFYSYAVSFSHLIVAIWSGINNSWVSFLFDDLGRQDYVSIKKKSENYLFIFTCFSFGFLMALPEMVRWFGRSEYSNCLPYIPLLAVSGYFVFLYSFAVNTELFNRKTYFTMVGTVAAALMNILLNYFFIRQWSLFGAALATLVSYFFLFLFHYLVCLFFLKKDFPFSPWFFIKGTLVMGVGIACYYFFLDEMAIRWCFGFAALFFIILSITKRRSLF
jgi:O-antigen/teichoic acid export membrane protein